MTDYKIIKMSLRTSKKAYQLVQNVKDLNKLKEYGLSETEINELKGIRQEGKEQINTLKKELREALEDMEEAQAKDSDSSDSEEQKALGDEEKNQHIRKRRRTKTKYIFKFRACGKKYKVDNCLCARMILASILMLMIVSVFYCIITIDRSLSHKE